MIVGGAIGAIALIGGIFFLISGGQERPKPRPVSTPGGMTREEARRIKGEGKAELVKGDALCRQAGSFNSPGYAAKMNEARVHLNKAMESFNKIPDSLSDPELRSMSQQCARLLAICFKVPISH